MGSNGTAQGFPFPLCGQCGQSFDGEEHRPLLLPCGHVFCKKCLNEQEDFDNQLCMECSQSWSHSNISQLPVVLDLENGGAGPAGGKGRKVPLRFPSCKCCQRKYNASSYRPFLLPCGHCCCRSCLELLRNSGNSFCSVCPSDWGTADMTKLRCVKTLVHPSNVNSEGHQSLDGNNYDFWSHDEPPNYHRTDRPGGGTEILAPKEACAEVEDEGVFSGESSESGGLPACEGSPEGRGSPEGERSSEICSPDDGFTDLGDVLSSLTMVHCDQHLDPAYVPVVSNTETQPTLRLCSTNLELDQSTTCTSSAKTQQRTNPFEILSGAMTARSQNGHQLAPTLFGATAARNQNGHQPVQTQSGTMAASRQNGHQPTLTLFGATATMSQNGHQPAQTQSGATTAKTQNAFQPAQTQSGSTTARSQNYFHPAQTQSGVMTAKSQNAYQPAQIQSGVMTAKSQNAYQPTQTQSGVTTAKSQNAYQSTETQSGTTPTRSQNAYQPAQTQSGATAAKSQNAYQPAQTQSGATTAKSPNAYQPTQTQSGTTPVKSQNAYQPALTQSGATTAKSQNAYHQPAQTQSGATTAKSQNAYQPTQTQSGATTAKSQNAHQPTKTQSGSTTTRRRNRRNRASAVKNQPESPDFGGWTQTAYSSAHYELAAPRVTSQRPEQSFRTAQTAPVIPPPPKKSQIFVRNTQNRTDAYQLDLKKDTVDTLMSLIFEKTKFRPQRLVYEGHQLQEGLTLASYSVKPEATIYETCRLVGGGQNYQ